jgi:hypothetical protein
MFSSSLKKDPAIMTGRKKVADAEEAERAADEALSLARITVREAKEHVKALEREALEEYAFIASFSCLIELTFFYLFL